MKFIQGDFIVFFIFFVYPAICKKQLYDFVTCGSTLKLVNIDHQVRLHSHEVKYGSGSGQQSVTGKEGSDDTNSYWQVRGRTGVTCKRGEPVKCGSTVRITHVSTHRNLHSHAYASPLSNNQEVSAFGEKGVGDNGDDWKIECSEKYWRRADEIRLRHQVTGTYLCVTGHRFGRPIQGQAEVCTIHESSSPGVLWRPAEGVFVLPSTPLPNASSDSRSHSNPPHDEF